MKGEDREKKKSGPKKDREEREEIREEAVADKGQGNGSDREKRWRLPLVWLICYQASGDLVTARRSDAR